MKHTANIRHQLYPQKTKPLLFLQHLWFLLTNFNNFFIMTIETIIEHISNKIYHLIICKTALCVKMFLNNVSPTATNSTKWICRN